MSNAGYCVKVTPPTDTVALSRTAVGVPLFICIILHLRQCSVVLHQFPFGEKRRLLHYLGPALRPPFYFNISEYCKSCV